MVQRLFYFGGCGGKVIRAMKVEIDPGCTPPHMIYGYATSMRGRRYRWCYTVETGHIYAEAEYPPDPGTWWNVERRNGRFVNLRIAPALTTAVRRLVASGEGGKT